MKRLRLIYFNGTELDQPLQAYRKIGYQVILRQGIVLRGEIPWRCFLNLNKHQLFRAMRIGLIQDGVPVHLECNVGFTKKLIGLRGGGVCRIRRVILNLNTL